MNQDKVKNILLSTADSLLDFTLIFSGKKSSKVNGLYKPDTREIIIHNKNFENGETVDDNGLIYTALHEYAHHQHACKNGGTLPHRSHTTEFWAMFHSLLEIAQKKGYYKNSIAESSELAKLTKLIKEKFLQKNGELVKDFGKQLVCAMECCKKEGIRFEDYIDRILCIPRSAAKIAMKMAMYDLHPQVGGDNMRFLANIPNKQLRIDAEQSLLEGKSPDTVKMQFKNAKKEDPKLMLVKERERLRRTIDALNKKLEEVERRLDEEI
ncbi:hypothetical protein FACS1894102_7750 [Spirochaetia bacterium]|nr:hypothetical protein FACS1894102_7750 [Spirochaetia bacterium]